MIERETHTFYSVPLYWGVCIYIGKVYQTEWEGMLQREMQVMRLSASNLHCHEILSLELVVVFSPCLSAHPNLPASFIDMNADLFCNHTCQRRHPFFLSYILP